jgi:hypothetical protein
VDSFPPQLEPNDDREVVEIFADPVAVDAESVNWRAVSALNRACVENRIHVPVSIFDGRVHDALVDSGAVESVVHLSLLKQYNIPVLPIENRVIVGFGPNNVTTVVGKCSLELTLHGNKMLPMDFLVLEADVLGETPIFLATDFFCLNKVTVDMQRRRLTFVLANGTRCELYVGCADSPCLSIFSGIPCCASSRVIVQPGQVVDVDLCWSCPSFAPVVGCDYCQDGSDGSLFLFEESDCMIKRQAFSGLFAVNDSHGGGKVLVINNGSEPEVIQQGELIGSLSSVVDSGMLHSSGEVYLTAEAGGSSSDNPVFQIGSHLSDEQKTAIQQLLGDRRAVFSTGDDDVGCIGITNHRIELYDYTPIYLRPRRFPEVVNKEIEDQCRELELLDVIEPSSSPWSSPVVPIRKKDGSLRLCIDYRKLNAVTKPDRFPLPNLNDAVFGLHGMRYFTSMDLVRGYYQLPLDEASREFTAFSTHREHWQFKRLSFGLRNAPSAFQREMQRVLSHFPWRKVIVYIDDVLVMSETFEEHLELVAKVLLTLEEHGVKIKGQKCHWFEEEVTFLGHVVSSQGLAKPQSYIDAVTSFPRPTTVKELRKFLGLVNFQRKFVSNCSVLMKPLSKLTGGRGSSKIIWSDIMIEAFESLKSEMEKDITLSFPDYSPGAHPLQLYTDASAIGAGALLSQKQNGQHCRIAYASIAFTKTQQNYNTLERELAAIRWGIKSFRAFLFGVEFVVHTDHQPLVYLNNMQIVNSRLARTLEDLSDFTFVIQYTPGSRNTAADTLSRFPRLSADTEQVPTSPDLPLGLTLLDKVEGGGDSMVHSLFLASQHVTLSAKTPATAGDLRLVLVDEIAKSPENYNLVPSKELRRSLVLLKHPGQLMCVEVLLAFSFLFRCVVLVHYGGNIPVVYLSDTVVISSDLPRVHLRCLASVHYDPVGELTSYVIPKLLLERDKVDCELIHSDIVGGVVDDPESISDDEANVLTAFVRDRTWCGIHTRFHLASVMISCMEGEFCALFDTGAQISCVSYDAFQKLEATLDPENGFYISGVGPNHSPVIGSTQIEVKVVGSQPINHTFAVVDSAVMPYCFILGADFVSLAHIQLDYEHLACISDTGVEPMSPVSTEVHFVGLLSIDQYSSCLPRSVEEICVGSADTLLNFGLMHDGTGELSRLTNLIERDQILKMQKSDRQLIALRKQLVQKNDIWPKSVIFFRRYREFLNIVEDILVFQGKGEMLSCVVSFPFLVEITLVLHYKMAHLGRQKLMNLVSEHVWHPSLSKVSADITRSCMDCQRVKIAPTVQPPIIKIVTASPFELVAVDLISFPMTKRRHVGCLVLVDHNSKWLAAVPLTSKKAETVTNAMGRQVLPFLPKVPIRLLSDNGAEFRSGEFNQLLLEHNIDHVYTTPYKPSSNGMVERANRTLTEILRNLSASLTDWDDYLAKAIMVYNTTFHSEIEMSPSQYLLTKAHTTFDTPLVPTVEVENWREGNPSFVPYSVGMKVLRKVVTKGRLLADKFASKFEGPFVITRVNDNGVTYWIKDVERQIEARVHHSQLKRFHDVPCYIQRHPYFRQLKSELIENREDLTECSDQPAEDRVPNDVLYSGTSDDSEEFSSDESSESSCFDSLPSGFALSVRNSSANEVSHDFLDFSGFCDVPSLNIKRRILELESQLHSEQLDTEVDIGLESPVMEAQPCRSRTQIDHCLEWSWTDISVDHTGTDNIIENVQHRLQDIIKTIDDVQDLLVSSGSFHGFSPSNHIVRDTMKADPGAQVDQPKVPIDAAEISGFSGFDLSEAKENSLLHQVENVQKRLQGLLKTVSDDQICDAYTEQPQFVRRRTLSEGHCSYATRSRGSVPEQPNVQYRILEYNRR